MNSRFSLCVLPRTQRGSSLPMDASPDGKKFIYCHGHSVIIRDFDSPQYADIYTQHSTDVMVAKYSPSGFYIASADKSGKVRIWDTVNQEHILKNEFQPISGPIKDLCWSSDNQRMVVVGEGREKFGHVFLADTGTSNGDITGQSRPVNSCDFKPTRPFRIVTGSEDNTAAVYEGPPFRFKTTKSDHSRYCQVVRYSPDGKYWASAGFDGKVFLYEGKDSELIGEIQDQGKNAHDGGIYGLSWSPDSKKLLTVSGDKSCKIWDVETKSKLTKFVIGDKVQDQQLGCLWSGDHLLSVSLSGQINYLDPKDPSKPSRIIEGHNKPITAIAKVNDKMIYTGDSDGRIVQWETENGVAKQVNDAVDSTNCQVNGMTRNGDNGIFSVGIDDCLKKVEDLAVNSDTKVKLSSQPKAVDSDKGLTFVATVNSVAIIQDNSIIHEQKMEYEPACIAVSPRHQHIIVGEGGHSGKCIHVYRCNETGDMTELFTAPLSGAVTDVVFSPDQELCAVADSNRKVTLLKVGEEKYEKAHSKEWGFHTAKVNCVAFSPNGQFVASGGLDCTLIIWSVEHPAKHHILPSAHVQSQITGVCWMDNSTLCSSGQDGNVKIWNVTWKPV